VRPLTVVLGLLALQGVVGGVQWALKLPGEIVWVHVALATITWLAMLWAVATAGRLEPRHGRLRSEGTTKRQSDAPTPALTQS
jgi:cytochrome c oxidase assembly protein subunit 15